MLFQLFIHWLVSQRYQALKISHWQQRWDSRIPQISRNAAWPTFGKLSEYQAETESFSTYVERVKIFFTANDGAEDKQLPVSSASSGQRTCITLQFDGAREAPNEGYHSSYEGVGGAFRAKAPGDGWKFSFHRQNQLLTESVAEYVCELQRLSTHCDFCDYLNDTLRDHPMCGLHSGNMQSIYCPRRIWH